MSTESIQFLDNLGSGVEGHVNNLPSDERKPLADGSGNQAPPSHPYSDTLTTAERMAQFEDKQIRGSDATAFWLIRNAAADAVAEVNRIISELPEELQPIGRKLASKNKNLQAALASAISNQLVDFDISDYGEAICWDDQDREVRLEFNYDYDPGDYYQPATHFLEITGASYGPMDNWAEVKLPREQEQQAQASILAIYPQWLANRRDEETDHDGPFTA